MPRVLIVEDEPEIAELYQAYLGPDFDVEKVESGTKAIELLDASFDIVILDRRMPGLSGDEVAEHIQADGFDCRVVMLSALGHDEEDPPPCDEYIEKPVSREDFETAVTPNQQVG